MMMSIDNADERRKSSSVSTLMALNCNASSIPIINEPAATVITPTAAEKKKAIRFNTNTFTSDYDSDEIRETKRKITAEIKK